MNSYTRYLTAVVCNILYTTYITELIMYGNTCGMYSDNSGFERYLRSRVITSMITDFAKVDICHSLW